MSATLRPSTERGLASAVRSAAAPAALRFQRALAHPERAQRARLVAVLRAVSGSLEARRIRGLDRVRSAREFQDAVPLCTADDLAPAIERIARGSPRVLTREPVLRFERSGGSSGASKRIPYTSGLLGELHAALLPWLHDLARARPRAWAGPGYWSISPMGQAPEPTPGGIPVGTDDDSAYFPVRIATALARGFVVPGAIARLPDVDSCRYVTLRLLIERPDLAFVSAWNPSFLTLLMRALDRDAERLLEDLAAGTCRPPELPKTDALARTIEARAARVRAVVERVEFGAQPQRARELRALLAREGRLTAASLWPELALISVWTDAQAERALPALRECFAGVEIQGKGLLASEGVVSIPWFGTAAPVLAVRSHFLEFIDEARPQARPRLAHELEPGSCYEVVMSTAAGFLRYRLGDRVRVSGRCAETPCVRFEGRADAVSDLVGEKLSADRVGTVLALTIPHGDRFAPPRFAMLAPEWGAPPGYRLYVEWAASDEAIDAWACRIEATLLEGFPYRYARDLGQLGPVRATRVEDAERRYEAGCVARGQRAGAVKPPDLELRTGWSEWMGGHQLRRDAGRRESATRGSA